MNLDYLFERIKDDPKEKDNLKKLYSNWFNISCVLYNALSEIVVITSENQRRSFEKVEEAKDVALNAIQCADFIGKTNPDFYDMGKRSKKILKKLEKEAL